MKKLSLKSIDGRYLLSVKEKKDITGGFELRPYCAVICRLGEVCYMTSCIRCILNPPPGYYPDPWVEKECEKRGGINY